MSRMTRKDFGKTMVRGLGGAALASTMVSVVEGDLRIRKPGRPNFVFVCSDHHRYMDTGYMGHKYVKTPNLDRIARQGVVFTNNYCSNPVCVPARSGMMTGVYASDVDSYCNSTVWDGSHPTWGTMLRRVGYYTRAVGKLDLNPAHDMGFEEFNTSHGHASNPDITSLFRRPLVHRDQERRGVDGRSRDDRHRDEGRTQHGVDFIRGGARKQQQPWALFVGLTQPIGHVGLKQYYDRYYPDQVDMPSVTLEELEELHEVFQQLRNFKNISTPIPEERIRRARAGYYAMVSELDEYVGRLWDALKQTGQMENTIFIYTSDHGSSQGEHGLWLINNVYDLTARVPLVMAGSGLPEGTTVDTPVGHVDVVATMLELAGAKGHKALRGYSLLPLIKGRKGKHPGVAFCETHSEGNATGSYVIRKGDWKYIHFTWYDDLLFNVAEDPEELQNRISDPGTGKVREELLGILRSLLNPDEVTLKAFKAQKRVLDGLVSSQSEAELVQTLQGRLGMGQARALASKLRGR